jgi:hypothetical protein
MSIGTYVRAGRSEQSNRAMRNLFCFVGLGFRVCLPYRHRRDCAAPKPGKKKQNRYDYGYAILIVHSFLE